MTRRSLFAAIAGVFGAKAAPTTVKLFHGAPTATAALMFRNGARVTGGVSRFVNIGHRITTLPLPGHVLTATQMREELTRLSVK